MRKTTKNWSPYSKKEFYFLSGILLVVGGFWLLYYFLGGRTLVVCPSKIVLGISCPGCGMTRAFDAIMHGDVCSAIFYNANALILFPFVGIFFFCFVWDLVFKTQKAHALYCKVERLMSRKSLFVVFLMAEFAIWLHGMFIGV